MKIIETPLEGVLLIEPRIFEDARGFFMESWNSKTWEQQLGLIISFVQDNHSCSAKNVLRGLHYQHSVPQGKLVRVSQGSIFDVAVDLRKGSSTFGQWYGTILSSDNRRQLWIPEGCAHGFLSLEDQSHCLYKVTNFYDPSYEKILLWNDSDLGIDWPLAGAPILSDRDRLGHSFRELLI